MFAAKIPFSGSMFAVFHTFELLSLFLQSVILVLLPSLIPVQIVGLLQPYEGNLEADFLSFLGQVQKAARERPDDVEFDFRKRG